MGDYDPNASAPKGNNDPSIPSNSSRIGSAEGSAFHSQLEHLSQQQIQTTQHYYQYGYHPFDMASMAQSLPMPGFQTMNAGQYGQQETPAMLSPAAVYQMQQASQYGFVAGSPIDSTYSGRGQQHQYPASPYGSAPLQASGSQRQPLHVQAPGQYAQFDPYGYGLSPMHVPPFDPRFASRLPYGMTHMQGDPAQSARRASEPAFVPSYPRGPPRKPKQSGHALWVGNLPPAATVTDLKDHFSKDATKDIESLFLISKSNCAFVNYRSEAACVAAMNRFHDSRFHGVRLVCRLRRGSAAISITPSATGADASRTPSSSDSPGGAPSPALPEEPSSPTIVGSGPSAATTPQAANTTIAIESLSKSNEKYFIVKSLTVQDLEASVQNGIWATQSHNEVVLNHAYDESDTVYLIFSANKSGEYFGYARMASRIAGEPVNLSSNVQPDEPPHTPGAPQSIPTPATATAPKGRIIDDSARGTIFWEAEQIDDDEDDLSLKESNESGGGQNWGRQFTIEWLSTTRLPFYRTRGLRNPWNANREVKIARDGTELEPAVGKRLLQMFTRPSPGPMPQNMPYH